MINLTNKRKIRVPAPKAFTLIELLVGISISVMLMVSVSIFVSSGMKNILDEENIIKNGGDFNYFSSKIQNIFNYTGSGEYIKNMTSSTGVLFKRGQYFGEGGFTYIGETIQDKVYCMSGSEDTKTNNLIVKTFVPFEEQGENMFSNIAGGYDEIFTGSVSGGGYTYISDALNNVIYSGSINAGNIIIGKGIYGDKFITGDFGTGIYLNNPTGLALSGSSILYISDTLNNRVLYYDIAAKKIHELLDENDGLLEPTGLYYVGGKLYISNSGKGEILEYSSPIVSTNPTLNIVFTGGTVNNINNFEIEFFTGVTLMGSSNTGSYNFNGTLNKYVDYATGSISKINYYFTNYINLKSDTGNINMGTCINSVSYYLNGNIPEKKIVNCITGSTGSIIIKQGNKFNTFNNGNKINISGITPNFSSTGTYYVNLKLFTGSTLKYQKYYPYFTQGDGDILTPGDNTLKVFRTGLKYPTGIWGTANNQYNEFNKTPSRFDFKNTSYNSVSDYLLKVPVKSLSIDYNNKFLTLFIKYYKKYDCYNLDAKVERSYILKKKF